MMKINKFDLKGWINSWPLDAECVEDAKNQLGRIKRTGRDPVIITMPTNKKNALIQLGKTHNGKEIYGGKCLIGLDFDIHSGNEVEYDIELVNGILGKLGLPETFVVKTGSGGLHIYYMVTDGVIETAQQYCNHLKTDEKAEELELIDLTQENYGIDELDIKCQGDVLFASGTDFSKKGNVKNKIHTPHTKPYSVLIGRPPASITIKQFDDFVKLIVRPEVLLKRNCHGKKIKYESKKQNIKTDTSKKYIDYDESELLTILKKEPVIDPIINFLNGTFVLRHGYGYLNEKNEVCGINVKEHIYWEDIFRSILASKISLESAYVLLEKYQPEFDLKKCENQCKIKIKTQDWFKMHLRNVKKIKEHYPEWKKEYYLQWVKDNVSNGSKKISKKAPPHKSTLVDLLDEFDWLKNWRMCRDSKDVLFYWDESTGLWETESAGREITRIENEIYSENTGFSLRISEKNAVQYAYEIIKKYYPDRMIRLNDMRMPSNFLPVNNGILEYIEGEKIPKLHDFSPKFFVTQKLSINYYPELANDPTPYFNQYRMLYPEIVADLEHNAGNCCAGENKGDTMHFVVGPGGYGKSTFLKVFGDIFKEFVGSATIKDLVGAFGLANIVGKRLIMKNEITTGVLPEGGAEFFKYYTGDAGNPISVNEKYKGQYYWSFDSMFFLFSSNGLFTLSDGQEGWWRRARVHEFIKEIPDTNDDFPKLLEGEYEILFAKWATQGVYKFCDKQEFEDKGLTRSELINKNKVLWKKWARPVDFALDKLFTSISDIVLKEETYNRTDQYNPHMNLDDDGIDSEYIKRYVRLLLDHLKQSEVEIYLSTIKNWATRNKIIFSSNRGVTTFRNMTFKISNDRKLKLTANEKKETLEEVRANGDMDFDSLF